ncbi:MAG: bestrophin family protein [Myxococcales bacterium]|nr:bestrophin family protein [Myxococcales bacterium]
MMTGSRPGSVLRLLRWQARNALIFLAGGTAAYLLYEIVQVRMQWADVTLPALPMAVVGGALGIFVSFRVNAGYDRWWEGRKLWGRLINSSRHWGSQADTFVDDDDVRKRLIVRHIAYVHLLRCLLRSQDPLEDDDCVAFLTDGERTALPEESNPTHFLLNEQMKDVTALANAGTLNELRLQRFDETVRHLLDIQGGCERIKKTPLPPGYGFIAVTLIRYMSFLFPLAIVDHIGVWSIPVTLLVCLAFMLINETGRVIETPFSLFWNGLPLQNMSTTIEHNLRNRLGEPVSALPVIPGPDDNGVLM